MIVSTVTARNFPPFARRPLPFFIIPAGILPPFARWRRGLCLRLHAGRCLSSPRRRAFFFPFLRRLGRFDSAGGEFVFVCTLAAAFFHLAGVHFSFCFSAGLILSTMPAGILSPFARWAPAFLRLTGVHFSFHFSAALILSTMPAGILSSFARRSLPLLASPACIFLSISPPP